jgi:hypothetical protein
MHLHKLHDQGRKQMTIKTKEEQPGITAVKGGRTADKMRLEKACKLYQQTGNKTAACAAVGLADPNANCTRYFAQPEARRLLAEIEQEHLAAMDKVGLTPLAWAMGLKSGVDAGNPAALRLYAEVVKLVGEDKAQQVVVLVVQRVVQLIAPYVPVERRGELMRDLETLNGGEAGN